MSHRRRLIRCAIAAAVIAAWTTTVDAGADPRPAAGTGCRGLSPASAQNCTADQLRAALDR